jgi:hypothetical protein
MANEISTAAKNTMLDALTPDLISLHNGDPGASGTANEVSGGGYARQAAVFAAASGGARALNANVTFSGTPGAPVTHIGIWKNAGTVFLARDAITGDSAFNASGQFVITTATQIVLSDP